MARYEPGFAVMADGDRPVYSRASDPVIHPFEEGQQVQNRLFYTVACAFLDGSSETGIQLSSNISITIIGTVLILQPNFLSIQRDQ